MAKKKKATTKKQITPARKKRGAAVSKERDKVTNHAIEQLADTVARDGSIFRCVRSPI